MKPKTKKHPILKGCGCLLLVMLAGMFVLLALVLGTAQNYTLPPTPTREEQETVKALLEKVHDSMVDRSGAIMEESRVTLSATEVNALLRIGLRYMQQKEPQEKHLYFITFVDGQFVGKYSFPLPLLALNGECRFVPELKERTPEMKVAALQAGLLPLPTQQVQTLLQQFISDWQTANEREYESIMLIIKEVRITETKELELIFDSREIGPVLKLLNQQKN